MQYSYMGRGRSPCYTAATDSQMIPPQPEKFMAKRLGTQASLIPS